MKSGKITLKNYRSIPFDNPITFELNNGITFILGANNIGKSNILRFFYEFRNLSDYDNQSININFQVQNPEGKPIAQILNQTNYSRDLEVIFEIDEVKYNFKFKSHNSNYSSNKFQGELTKENSSSEIFEKDELGYIFEILTKSLYIGSFRNASFNSTGEYYNIQIGTQFITTWDEWANGTNIHRRNKISNLVTELKELFEFEKLEISVNPEKTKLIIKNENGSFYLDELGGGISHFIIVLGNALIQEPNFILIDEPENALHPKLQQTFVRVLASKAKYGLIATSHSIGLAKSVADNIYHLAKDNTTKRLTLSEFGNSYNPRLLNSIVELGYSQFVELGGNNILLVEGRTDIKVFKEILKKYNLEHHFIVMDLGGANNINGNSYEELSELKKLNAKSYSVIIDSEISSVDEELKENIAAFIRNCRTLGFNTFTTEVHSTENYITQEAINTVIGSNYPALDKYENMESHERKTNSTKWGKSFNWRMFKEMKLEDFYGTKLNDFILQTLKPNT